MQRRTFDETLTAAPNAYYDLFDAAAKRVARLTLSRNRRVLAVGPRGTWVAATDEDGLQQLEFYAGLREATR